MTGMDFMRNLSESGLVPDKHSLSRFKPHALAELAFLYILCFRILLIEDETHEWAKQYARRSSLGSSFHSWRSDGSDLYVLMFAVSSPEADDDSNEATAIRERLSMFSHTIFKWLKDAASRRDVNEQETRRVFTSLDVKFHIQTPPLRALRRVVQDWPHLHHHEQRATMTRLLQLLRDRAHKGELYVHLNSLAGRLDLKDEDVMEATTKLSFLRDLDETASSGATGAASVATVAGGIGAGFDDDYSKSIYPPPKKKPKVLMLRRPPIV